MKQHLVLFAIVFLTLVSCSRGVGNEGVDTITIPFDKLSSSAFDPASFHDWKRSTVCFQSDESGMGRLVKIDKIRVYDGDYYVLDRLQRLLIRYSPQGMPLNTIGQKGRGPEEYLSISDFSINMEGQVVMLDGQLDDIIIYDKDGTFVSRQKMKHDYGELFHLDNGEILLACNAWDRSELSGTKVVLADASLKPSKVISSFVHGYDPNFVIPHIGFNDYLENVSYVCPIDDKVYVFPKIGGNAKSYLIDFGSERVEESQMINLEKSFPEIKRNNTFLLNATLMDDLQFIMSVYEKGEWRDFYVDAKTNTKTALTPLGIRFLGSSKKTLFFEVTNPELMTSFFHSPLDTVESIEKRVVAFSK